MKKISLLVAVLINVSLLTTAQDRYYTKTGAIIFDGKSTFDKIHALNKQAACVLDTKSGSIHFALLMKGFEFNKALMQTHFNEKYLESDKFPQSEFKGQVINNSSVKYTTEGVYDATVKGKLTIHGETNDVDAAGKITITGGKILLASTFIL